MATDKAKTKAEMRRDKLEDAARIVREQNVLAPSHDVSASRHPLGLRIDVTPRK